MLMSWAGTWVHYGLAPEVDAYKAWGRRVWVVAFRGTRDFLVVCHLLVTALFRCSMVH